MKETPQIIDLQTPPAHPGMRTVRMLKQASRPAKLARALRAVAFLAAVALLARAAFWLGPRFLTQEPPPRVLAVRPRRIESVLHEIGYISSSIERPVLTSFAGEITWRAEDGTLVEAGDPVVMFDAKTLQDDIELRERDLFDKQDSVRLAEDAIGTIRKKYARLIRQKKLTLMKAELDQKKAVEFPLPDDLLDVELTWKSAALDMNQNQVQTDSMKELTKRGFNSEAALRKKQLELANAKVECARAKMIYDLTHQGTTPDLIQVAKLAVADARKSLNVAIFNRKADLATGQAALELVRLSLANFERDLQRRKQHLESATVRAPMRGRVIFQSIFKGSVKNRSPIQVGETRPEGSDLCTLLDTSQLIISLWINEMDIGGVRLKQRARVFLPALPDESFDAEVIDISVTAQDKNIALSELALRRSGEAFVNVVRVKMGFAGLKDEVKNRIRVGFTADVKLDLGIGGTAVSAPWQAIGFDPGGKPFSDVLVNGKIERRELKLGRSDNINVEVLSGLSDGMSVVDRSRAAIPYREDAPRSSRLPDLQAAEVSRAPGTEAERE